MDPKKGTVPVVGINSPKDYKIDFDDGTEYPIYEKKCGTCGIPCEKRCSRCHITRYCSVKCQQDDWKHHKILCDVLVSPTPTSYEKPLIPPMSPVETSERRHLPFQTPSGYYSCIPQSYSGETCREGMMKSFERQEDNN